MASGDLQYIRHVSVLVGGEVMAYIEIQILYHMSSWERKQKVLKSQCVICINKT